MPNEAIDGTIERIVSNSNWIHYCAGKRSQEDCLGQLLRSPIFNASNLRVYDMAGDSCFVAGSYSHQSVTEVLFAAYEVPRRKNHILMVINADTSVVDKTPCPF